VVDRPTKVIDEWFQGVLSALPMYRLDQPEGQRFVAQLKAQADAEQQAKQERRERLQQRIKPECTRIVFSGVAAAHREDLDTVNGASDKGALVAAHPLACETVSGGRSVNGAILNPWSRTTCRGVGLFRGQAATVQDWTQNKYWVATNVDLDTGRRPLALWINRADARCAK